MRVVTLEEHVSFPELMNEIPQKVREDAGWISWDQEPKAVSDFVGKLSEVGAARLDAMDSAGIDVQVLSYAGPGAELLGGSAGHDFAREVNTRIAATVEGTPTRFAGLAHLPLRDPDDAAAELDYAVRSLGMRGALVMGTVDGLFLDDARFTPVLEAATQLQVPLYLHPGIPPLVVRQAYYQGLPVPTSIQLSQAAYGWHAETAIHVLRLTVSGTLSRYPELQIIVGHMGETLPFMLARIDREFAHDADLISEPVSAILRRQLWVTSSGMFTQGPLDLLRATLGSERTMFSIDYPFESMTEGRAFLDSLTLPQDELDGFASARADQLLRLETSSVGVPA